MEQQKSLEPVQDFMEKMAYQRVKKALSENGYIDTSGYRDEYLRRRFEVRLRATGAETYAKYLAYLKKNPDEMRRLQNDLTINFTSFFRDGDVYQYLERRLLPKILLSPNPVRIWSAGCASGEESYSLAIIIYKLLQQAPSKLQVTIFASDIDREALSIAKNGVYNERQISTVDKLTLEKCFTKEENHYIVKDFLKRLVCFEHSDLMAPPKHQSLDLILCRNVMIYFSKEGQQHVHMSFYRALRENGYFITGKSEILSSEIAKRFSVVDFQSRVYQKEKTAELGKPVIQNRA